jgi:Rhodopirellula transposase DDE domain
MGSKTDPGATQRLITADGDGSNGGRRRPWKSKLQEFADEIGRRITVGHFPPGTSQGNKIEHRMFRHITENWRGRPLVDHEVVVNLIGATTTETGLEIQAQLDDNLDPVGQKVTKQQMKDLSIKQDKFPGEWNYTIEPRQSIRWIILASLRRETGAEKIAKKPHGKVAEVLLLINRS